MFCGECGTKNEAGSTFCKNCGKPLSTNPVVEEEKKTTKKNTKKEEVVSEPVVEPVVTQIAPVTPNPKQPMPKKKKMILFAVLAIALVLGVTYKVLGNKYSPKNIAKGYIKAVTTCNANKLYSYLDTSGNSEFLDKGAFVKYISDKCESNITNFKVTKVEYSDSKLSATVTFSYTTKTGRESTDKVVLTKDKNKKLLIFDNWKVGDDFDSAVANNYTLVVDKGSTITFGSKVVDKKYLDVTKSTETKDYYVLPKVLSVKTNVKVTLANGFSYEKEVTPGSYEKVLTLDEYVISDDIKNNIFESSKSIIAKLYTSVIEGKTADDIKTIFKHKADLTDLASSYTKVVNTIPGSYSRKLTKFEITSGSLYDLSVTKDGYLEVEVKLYYNYSLDYKDFNDEPKTHDDSDYSYMTILLEYSDGNFYLVGAPDLEYEFSIY